MIENILYIIGDCFLILNKNPEKETVMFMNSKPALTKKQTRQSYSRLPYIDFREYSGLKLAFSQEYKEFAKKYQANPYHRTKKQQHKADSIILSEKLSVSKNSDALNKNRNVIVVGDDIMGNQMHYTLPNIFTATGSIVVLDHSGFIRRNCIAELEAKSYEIYELDYDSPSEGNCYYNPITQISNVKDVERLALHLIASFNITTTKDDAFYEALNDYLCAALHYIKFHDTDDFEVADSEYFGFNPNHYDWGLKELYSYAQHSETEVDYDCDYENAIDLLMSDVYEDDPDNWGVKKYRSFQKYPLEIKKEVVDVCIENMKNYDNIKMDHWPTRIPFSDELTKPLKLKDLTFRKIAVFVRFPKVLESAYYSVFFGQLFDLICPEEDKRGEDCSDLGIDVFLETPESEQRLYDLTGAMLRSSRHGVGIHLIISSMRRFKNLYGIQNTEFLCNGAGICMYLGSHDKEDSKWIIQQLASEHICTRFGDKEELRKLVKAVNRHKYDNHIVLLGKNEAYVDISYSDGDRILQRFKNRTPNANR
jgi:hypothetical protein